LVYAQPFNSLARACLALLTILGGTSFAQTRPDSGSTQQQPEQQIQKLPGLGAPSVTSKAFKRAVVGGDIKLTPAGFRFSGNTLISNADLQAAVAGLVGKQIDFNGLAEAASSLRQLYAAQGYVLTDVYLPEQQFSASGGIVEFAVVEARVGLVRVKVAENSGISESYALDLAQSYLVKGTPITQYVLDEPVLLLRDMPGTDAEAVVMPGSEPGEADVEILVTQRGKSVDPFVALDNAGARSAGEYRLTLGATVNAPLQLGDVLSAQIQAADQRGSALYRLSYTLAAGIRGTKLTASFTQSRYALGKQFASLGALGKAEVAGWSAVHPLVRGRYTNLFASIELADKMLTDTVNPDSPATLKHVVLFRLGLLGNHSDRLLAGGATNFSVGISGGKLNLMDSQSQIDDIGAFGSRAAGNFYKINAELQRVQYLSDSSSILLAMTGQFASKNLTSAEKFSLGGPTGVRGYPIGELVGDEGAVVSLEYRYLTGWLADDQPLSLSAFTDYGSIRRDKKSRTSNIPNSAHIQSAGFGLLLGREGNYVVTAMLATRLGGTSKLETQDPDARPRAWVRMQKWF
jgi:hemolysin activation/secretion protein